MSAVYLKMRLCSPMMSFGTAGATSIEFRGTDGAPTVSMLRGLTACALGLTEADPEYQDLYGLEFYYRKVDERWFGCPNWDEITEDNGQPQGEPLHGSLHRERDYQIISPYSGYGVHAMFRGADGKINKPQIVSQKEYLVNGQFVVYANGPEALLRKIHAAFLDPKWPVFIGRACCTPAEPIVKHRNVCEDLADSMPKGCVPCM